MAEKEKITIQDIANISGVSIATVSRVLNGKNNVREETRNKVMEAVEKSGEGFELKQKLDQKRCMIVAVICDGVNPTATPFVAGVQQCAKNNNYYTFQYNCVEGSAQHYEELQYIMDHMPVAGFVFQNTFKDTSIIDRIASRYPAIISFEKSHNENIPCVRIDDFSASKIVVEYLLSIGKKRIALLNSSLDKPFAQRREAGYKEALENAGIPINPEYIVHLSNFNFNLAMSAAEQVLSLDNPPDAFFAITDTFAVAALKEAKRIGLSIPQDLAIVGFDNNDVSIMTEPTITTVNQPSFDIGYQSCSLLVDKIAQPSGANKNIVLNYEFVVRGSTHS